VINVESYTVAGSCQRGLDLVVADTLHVPGERPTTVWFKGVSVTITLQIEGVADEIWTSMPRFDRALTLNLVPCLSLRGASMVKRFGHRTIPAVPWFGEPPSRGL
jgi:hypothetical protein